LDDYVGVSFLKWRTAGSINAISDWRNVFSAYGRL